MALPDIRRIVTGHDGSGKAVVLTQGALPHVTRPSAQPGLAFHEIWNTTQMPSHIDFDEPEPTDRHRVTAPPENGTIIRIVDIPPEGPDGPGFDKAQAKAVFDAVGLGENAEHTTSGRHPLMHRTRSIDYGYVISGKITLLLDEDVVDLVAGNVVIQRGTIHAWANRSNAICRMLFVLTDGHFVPDLAAAQAAQDARVKAGG